MAAAHLLSCGGLLLGCSSLLRTRPLHKFRLQRQFVRSQAHRFLRDLRRYAFHLEQDLAGTNDGYPVIQRALARTHSNFGRLLGNRLVRKETKPDLAAALDEAGHGDTAGFDLPVSNVAALQNLQTVLTERQRRTTPRLTAALALLLLPELNFLRHQHSEIL